MFNNVFKNVNLNLNLNHLKIYIYQVNRKTQKGLSNLYLPTIKEPLIIESEIRYLKPQMNNAFKNQLYPKKSRYTYPD